MVYRQVDIEGGLQKGGYRWKVYRQVDIDGRSSDRWI